MIQREPLVIVSGRTLNDMNSVFPYNAINSKRTKFHEVQCGCNIDSSLISINQSTFTIALLIELTVKHIIQLTN